MIPDLASLAARVQEICRSLYHVLVDEALDLLDRWQAQSAPAHTAVDQEDREKVHQLLRSLREVLVPMKRHWSALKEKLEERFAWTEPLIGDGTFNCLKERSQALNLPDLGGLAAVIKEICLVDGL